MTSLDAATTAVPPAGPAAGRAAGKQRFLRARQILSVLATIGFFVTVLAAPTSVNRSAAADDMFTFRTHALHQALTAVDAELALDTSASEPASSLGDGNAPAGALFSLTDFMFRGVINWGGYRFTFYSQQVLPGGGLNIPGRHVNAGGYVSDGDGYIVLAGSAPMGTVYKTPFGYEGKIYDRGTTGNHLDVYIR